MGQPNNQKPSLQWRNIYVGLSMVLSAISAYTMSYVYLSHDRASIFTILLTGTVMLVVFYSWPVACALLKQPFIGLIVWLAQVGFSYFVLGVANTLSHS